MNALADAIAAHCPPEREVSFDWPDAIRFDAGLLGGGRLGWPAECIEDDIPEWLVFGVILRAAAMAHVPEVQAAMAFTPDYVITGTSKRVRVRQLGNGVTPPAAEWLVAAAVDSLERTTRRAA